MFQWILPAPKITRVNFEFLKAKAKEKGKDIIIHTLEKSEQYCLIKDTLTAEREESILNEYLTDYNTTVGIIVYGRNSVDESAYKKCEQLAKLGFVNIYYYVAGLFEWLLLQELYGKDEFPTDGKCRDLLAWR